MTQRIALVTGASSGIGRATAKLFAEKGFYVFVMARRISKVGANSLETHRTDPVGCY